MATWQDLWASFRVRKGDYQEPQSPEGWREYGADRPETQVLAPALHWFSVWLWVNHLLSLGLSVHIKESDRRVVSKSLQMHWWARVSNKSLLGLQHPFQVNVLLRCAGWSGCLLALSPTTWPPAPSSSRGRRGWWLLSWYSASLSSGGTFQIQWNYVGCGFPFPQDNQNETGFFSRTVIKLKNKLDIDS